jgi:hypothetical protein
MRPRSQAVDTPPKNHSGVNAVRRRMTSAAGRHFAAVRRKKHAYAKDLEKTAGAIWFALDTRHRAAL